MIDRLNNYNEKSKIALIIRHADRELIPEGEFGNEVLINDKGKKNSINFGNQLQQYKICSIYTSPIERCIQTAEFIAKGYNKKIKIIKTTSLGDPGLHVSNENKAGDFYLTYGFDEMYRRYVNHQQIPGVPTPSELKKSMTQFIKTNTKKEGITIFITHDSVIAFYDFALNGKTYSKENWVNYLSGMIVKIN